jgi:hypothetical protein
MRCRARSDDRRAGRGVAAPVTARRAPVPRLRSASFGEVSPEPCPPTPQGLRRGLDEALADPGRRRTRVSRAGVLPLGCRGRAARCLSMGHLCAPTGDGCSRSCRAAHLSCGQKVPAESDESVRQSGHYMPGVDGTEDIAVADTPRDVPEPKEEQPVSQSASNACFCSVTIKPQTAQCRLGSAARRPVRVERRRSRVLLLLSASSMSTVTQR